MIKRIRGCMLKGIDKICNTSKVKTCLNSVASLSLSLSVSQSHTHTHTHGDRMHTETYRHLKGEIIYREAHTGIERENTHTTQTLKEHTLTHARTPSHPHTHTHTLLAGASEKNSL